MTGRFLTLLLCVLLALGFAVPARAGDAAPAVGSCWYVASSPVDVLDQLCFNSATEIESLHWFFPVEGIGSGGSYRFAGGRLAVRNALGEGWGWASATGAAFVCQFSWVDDALFRLHDCDGGVSDTAFIREDVRSTLADALAFGRLLRGCWSEDSTPLEQRLRPHGYSNDHTLCFKAGGVVYMDTVSQSETTMHASEATGAYALLDQKLRLDGGEAGDGWLFDRRLVACDAMVGPTTLRLFNCIGAEPMADGGPVPGERLPDLTFQRQPKS